MTTSRFRWKRGDTIVKGGAGKHVRKYLGKNYPDKDLDWVDDCEWQLDPAVRLVDIQMAHRPGGRDDQNLAEKIDNIRQGKVPKPIVIVAGLGPKYSIADGWTRTMAMRHSGHDSIAAWVGTPDKGVNLSDLAQTLRQMQFDTTNHPGDPDDTPH